MIPFCFEATRCLEENIASSADEIDLALLYGLGFPPHRGGALRYMDSIGLGSFCANAKQYHTLGAMYQPGEKLQAMADSEQSLY